jgi:hypothetical protein
MAKINPTIQNLWLQVAEIYREHGHDEVADHILLCMQSKNQNQLGSRGMQSLMASNICDAFTWSQTPFPVKCDIAYHDREPTEKARKLLISARSTTRSIIVWE